MCNISHLLLLWLILLTNHPGIISKVEAVVSTLAHSVKESYPFIILIVERSRTSDDIEYLCTGSVISRNQVLTAASCLENRNLQWLEAFAGKMVRSSSNSRAFDIKSKITYKDYEAEMARNGKVLPPELDDICIVELDTFSFGYKEVHISYEADPIIGSQVTFIGWGPSKNAPLPTIAQYVILDVLKRQVCDEETKVFSPAYRKFTWANKVFCVRGSHSTRVSDGDFGGPALLDGNNLVGIAIRPRPFPQKIQVASKQPILILRIGTYKDFIKRYLH